MTQHHDDEDGILDEEAIVLDEAGQEVETEETVGDLPFVDPGVEDEDLDEDDYDPNLELGELDEDDDSDDSLFVEDDEDDEE